MPASDETHDEKATPEFLLEVAIRKLDEATGFAYAGTIRKAVEALFDGLRDQLREDLREDVLEEFRRRETLPPSTAESVIWQRVTAVVDAWEEFSGRVNALPPNLREGWTRLGQAIAALAATRGA